MEKSRYPNRLRSFRRKNMYSQKKVARLLGFQTTSTLSRWERGAAVPPLMQVFRLARLYHTEPQELFPELWEDIRTETSLLAQHEQFDSNNPLYL